MIKKIYSLVGCTKCMIAKNKFKDAEYIMLNDLDSNERESIINKAKEKEVYAAPILIDENDDILTHQEAGL